MALKKSRKLGVTTTVCFALGSMSAFVTVVDNFTAIVAVFLSPVLKIDRISTPRGFLP